MATQQHWTGKEVSEQLEEAVRTLRRLPRHTVMGYRTLWPPIIYTTWELLAQEKLPLRLGPPSAQAIDRMEETFRWIVWLDVDERKMVWLRAANYPWKVVCQRFGMSRTTAWQHWTMAMLKIAHRLNGEKPSCRKQK
jgi:hypothetical protein